MRIRPLLRDWRARIATLLVAGSVLLTSACSDGSFSVERAPEFPRRGGSSVSVFGVYRDGRLAPEAWDVFRVRLVPLFGASQCEPGYPDILTPSGTAALQAVDDFSRANGVTDELLDKLAPMATGDLILLVTMTGRPGKPPPDNSGPSQAPATPSMRGGGRRGGPPPGRNKPVAEAPTFEAVGIVFSVKAHKSVAAIRMTYTGSSLEEALDRFIGRLGSELPASTCGVWKADRHIDPSEIRKLATD